MICHRDGDALYIFNRRLLGHNAVHGTSNHEEGRRKKKQTPSRTGSRLYTEAYKTKRGRMLIGRIEDVLESRAASAIRGKVNLIFTSPPFPLVAKSDTAMRLASSTSNGLKILPLGSATFLRPMARSLWKSVTHGNGAFPLCQRSASKHFLHLNEPGNSICPSILFAIIPHAYRVRRSGSQSLANG
jgi:hypothetical protein